MKRYCALAGLTLGCWILPLSARASGSYTGRPPRPPEHIDTARYELGKNLFMGKINPTAKAANRADQERRLRTLQDKLPKKVQTTVNLPVLAGKLTPEQQEGLEYFLSIRYKVK